MRRKNKKGSLADLAYILGIVMGAALLLLIFGKFSSQFNQKIQTIEDIPAEGKTAVAQIDSLYGGALDGSFLFLVIGLCIVTLIMAMMVVIHPVFFVFYFILLGVVIFVGGVVSNVYQKAASQPAMVEIADKLIFTSYVCQYLPFIIGVFGFILAMVMYKTWRNGGG